MKLHIRPSRIRGVFAVPGSKSHTIRGLMAALAAEGTSKLTAPLYSADTLAVRKAAETLGMTVREKNRDWYCTGTGGKYHAPQGTLLDLANSGTGLRFFTSMAAAGNLQLTLDGDESLRTRIMAGLLSSLESLGATCSSHDGRCPVTVCGPLKGGSAKVDGSTSQFISSLLFAAPLAEKDCRFDLDFLNERPYVKLTLKWLDHLGIRYTVSEDELHYTVPCGQKYQSFEAVIPADFSTALFPLAAAMVAGDGVEIRNLDFTDVQGDKACFEFFRAMGAQISEDGSFAGVSTTLQGGEFDLNATPDALPVMAAAAACIPAETRLVNAPQARIKETDRIRCMTQELRKMGADAEELPDGMVIRGGKLHGAEVEGHGDHRIVMALAVAALTAEGETVIHGSEAASVTYPDFVRDFQQAGADFTEEK